MREIIIKSAFLLNDRQKQIIILKATENYGKNISVKFLIDPDLIGGLLIYDNGKVIDNSISKQLSDIKNFIKQEL